jgi:hypothetical protein
LGLGLPSIFGLLSLRCARQPILPAFGSQVASIFPTAACAGLTRCGAQHKLKISAQPQYLPEL